MTSYEKLKRKLMEAERVIRVARDKLTDSHLNIPVIEETRKMLDKALFDL